MFYKFKSASNIKRKNPCCVCSKTEGTLVGKINYFNLETMYFVQCPSCGLISVDPMPNMELVSQGCSLLYKHQQGNETKNEY
jgi:hypothetical protein